MTRPIAEIVNELYERDAAYLAGRGELPGESQCMDEMSEACKEDPDGFISIIRGGSSEQIQTVAGFFDELTCLPDGAEWMKQIEEAVKGKETEDILNQIAFAKTCIPA